MPVVPDNVPPDARMTRFQAQKALGLFGTHDTVCLILSSVQFVLLVMAVFSHEFTTTQATLRGIGLAVTLLIWLIVLAYRILVWLLDINADINLMPEAAARIAAGFLRGERPPADKTKPAASLRP